MGPKSRSGKTKKKHGVQMNSEAHTETVADLTVSVKPTIGEKPVDNLNGMAGRPSEHAATVVHPDFTSIAGQAEEGTDDAPTAAATAPRRFSENARVLRKK